MSAISFIPPARNSHYQRRCVGILRNRLARIEGYVANGRSAVRREAEFASILALIRKVWPQDVRLVEERLNEIDQNIARRQERKCAA